MKSLLKCRAAQELVTLSNWPANSTAQAKELTFWTNFTTASQADVINSQIDQYRAQQGDLKVSFETIPFGAMCTRLITAMRNHSAPGIMNTLKGMALGTLATVPVVVLFSLVQRYFLRGVLFGAVKG